MIVSLSMNSSMTFQFSQARSPNFETGAPQNAGINVLTAAVFVAGEMAGSGVLALPKAVVDSGEWKIPSFLPKLLKLWPFFLFCIHESPQFCERHANSTMTPTLLHFLLAGPLNFHSLPILHMSCLSLAYHNHKIKKFQHPVAGQEFEHFKRTHLSISQNCIKKCWTCSKISKSTFNQEIK